MLTNLRLQNYPAIQFGSAEEWSDFLSLLSIPLQVETPDRRAPAWRVNAVQLEDIWVSFGTNGSALDIVQAVAGEGFTLLVPQAGNATLEVGGQTIGVSAAHAAVIDLSRPSRLHIEDDTSFKTIALRIPQGIVEKHLSALHGRNIRGPITFEQRLDLSSGAGAVLARLTDTMVTGLEADLLRHAPIAISNLTQALLGLLAETGRHQASDQVSRPVASIAPRHVRRAIDFMRANLDKPLVIAEVALACHTSVRSLQGGFREFRDTTPLAYLRQLRLEAVRAELVDPSGSRPVAEIAVKWGFAHLGRFSAEYREAFGELPSETARRARRRGK